MQDSQTIRIPDMDGMDSDEEIDVYSSGPSTARFGGGGGGSGSELRFGAESPATARFGGGGGDGDGEMTARFGRGGSGGRGTYGQGDMTAKFASPPRTATYKEVRNSRGLKPISIPSSQEFSTASASGSTVTTPASATISKKGSREFWAGSGSLNTASPQSSRLLGDEGGGSMSGGGHGFGRSDPNFEGESPGGGATFRRPSLRRADTEDPSVLGERSPSSSGGPLYTPNTSFAFPMSRPATPNANPNRQQPQTLDPPASPFNFTSTAMARSGSDPPRARGPGESPPMRAFKLPLMAQAQNQGRPSESASSSSSSSKAEGSSPRRPIGVFPPRAPMQRLASVAVMEGRSENHGAVMGSGISMLSGGGGHSAGGSQPPIGVPMMRTRSGTRVGVESAGLAELQVEDTDFDPHDLLVSE